MPLHLLVDRQFAVAVGQQHQLSAEHIGGRLRLLALDLGVLLRRKLAMALLAEIKRKEAQAAADVLGAELVLLPYRDGELPVNEEVQWHIADAIRKYRPTVLLTHWKGSLHKDHRNTHLNTMESLFFAGLKTFKREYESHYPKKIYFAENWEDMEGFVPDVYMDVSDVWDRYIEAIRCYSLFRGEVVPFPYEQWYRGTSEMRGAEAGVPRAVALMRPETMYTRRHTVPMLAE
jgi:N-acetylglucosamine malate deacetylase 1